MTNRTEFFDPKYPTDVLDYVWDWTDFLNGDLISTATFSAPTGLVINSNSHTTTTATAWISGGTANKSNRVTCTIVTAGGRTATAIGVIAVSDFT